MPESQSHDLFEHRFEEAKGKEAPLAARMRPRTFEDFVGQEHIVGKGRVLRKAIEADKLFSSIILWGPPGTGKTTLAQVIANTTKSHFTTISAILAGKADLRVVTLPSICTENDSTGEKISPHNYSPISHFVHCAMS